MSTQFCLYLFQNVARIVQRSIGPSDTNSLNFSRTFLLVGIKTSTLLYKCISTQHNGKKQSLQDRSSVNIKADLNGQVPDCLADA